MVTINWDQIPTKPGVYVWKNNLNEIIYVGKAKNLRDRMKQYFKGMVNSYKTQTLVQEIIKYDYFITSNEKEALILEKNYIDKYFPKYNILLMDDKRYPYIQISLNKKFEIKLIYKTIKNNDEKKKMFGPFPIGNGAKDIVNLISKITQYENGLIIKNQSKEFWEEKYNIAKNILSNNYRKIITWLNEKISSASKNLQYELAAEYKRSLDAIVKNKSEQIIELIDNKEIDVIGYKKHEEFIFITMMFYRYGSLLAKKDFSLKVHENIESTLKEFFERYYLYNPRPNLIVSNITNIDKKILNPIKGKFKRILNLAIINANDNLDFKIEKQKSIENEYKEIKKELSYFASENSFNHIMMIDNSHTANLFPVSVFVSFRNGIKQTNEYRKYNLVKKDRDADVEYMKQGMEKYFSKKTNVVPNLLIVDGGKAQINESKKIMSNLKIIGLVKNNHHKTESIVDSNGKKFKIKSNALYNFLSKMQIEVDRYAKVNHRKIRTKKTFEGKLTLINGVGQSIEKKLLNHFKTYSSIYNASIEDLKKVVSKKIAYRIYEEFKI